MTGNPALGVEKKKKKKKSKPAEEEAARPNGTQAQNVTSLQPEEKKNRLDENVQELKSEPPIDTVDVSLGKTEKKKKKKRKAANAEGEITEANTTLHQSTNGQVSVPDQPEKKQEKKKKSEPPSGQPELAAVGDRELARSGKPIVKALYTEHAAVSARTAAEVDAWRAERETVVTGRDMNPVMVFDEAGFSADLLQSTRTFAQPSPIQAQCWPIIQSGSDLVGIAATGSGKTLAFGLPGLKHILAQKAAGVSKGNSPTALVLAPTRELAQQIAVVLDEAGQAAGLRTLCVYGGVPKPPQTAALRKGVDVVVATPGRLEDLINDGACRLSGITYLVLDEADRMLDLGFEPHIRTIAGATRADRQTLMFSATWPPAIQKLASEFQASPTRVTIGSQDLSASHSVRQIVEVIDPAARDRRLEELLRKYHASRKNRVLVFVLYKKEAARVEGQLSKRGWIVRAIHGDINQRQRSEAVEHFKSGQCPLLIATDVAARGLDIPDVEAVINYSFPLTTEDYVHRIGRTGRAGKSGLSHTFFSGVSDKARAGELINVLREANQEVPEELLKFGTTVKRKEHKLFGAHFKDVDFTKKATKVSFDSDDE